VSKRDDEPLGLKEAATLVEPPVNYETLQRHAKRFQDTNGRDGLRAERPGSRGRWWTTRKWLRLYGYRIP
jgi:hypothetical protein